MPATANDTVFTGAIPEIYDTLFVPLIFEPYAVDLARRVAALAPSRVIETAAGTGAVTREIARVLPVGAELVATDLNPAMLDRARAVGTSRPVQWRVADALALPFADASADVVVCQFGAMFFPDRARGFAEARRVLRPGGTLLFNVWDRIEENEFAEVVLQALAYRFPSDPPRFMARTPHGYHDPAAIAADLAAGGFTQAPRIETLPARSRAASAQVAALAYCQGTPWRGEIEARVAAEASPAGDAPDVAAGLAQATQAAADAIAQRFGTGPIDGRIQALVVSVRK
jgi:SAM-dependent methyltransferase